MNILYDYLFHYNSYEELWYAIPRDQVNMYFTDKEKTIGVIHNKDIRLLIEYLHKSEYNVKI